MAIRDSIYVDVIAETKKSIGNIAKIAAGIGVAIIAIKKIIDVTNEMIDAASDAQEAWDKFNTVFADTGGAAEQAAFELANAFGMSSHAAAELVGNTGDLLTGFGFAQDAALDLSIKVNALAQDLASFTNFQGGSVGASRALTKALLGETESAKALGIVIRQDSKEYRDLISSIMEAEGVTLLQAKALAVLQMATEQSKNALGDYVRTADSWANVTRKNQAMMDELKVSGGNVLKEFFLPLKLALGEIVEGMADMANLRKVLSGEGGGIARGIETLKEKIESANLELQIWQKNLDDVERVGGDVSPYLGRVQDLNKEIGTLNSQLAQQTLRLVDISREEEKAAAAAKAIADGFAAEEAAIADAEEDVRKLAEAFADTHEGQVKALESSIAYFESFIQIGTVLPVLRDLRIALGELNGEIEKMTPAELGTPFSQLAVDLEKASLAQQEFFLGMREAEEAAEAVRALDVEIAKLEKDLKAANLADTIDDLKDSLISMVGEGALDVIGELGEAMGNAAKGTDDLKKSIGELAQEILDSLPSLLFQTGLSLIKGGNLEVGLALILASGLAKLGIGIGTGLADQEIADRESARGGNVTVNVEGSVVTDRDIAHTITAAQAGEYGSGY